MLESGVVLFILFRNAKNFHNIIFYFISELRKHYYTSKYLPEAFFFSLSRVTAQVTREPT
jgi:hypothetical protein